MFDCRMKCNIVGSSYVTWIWDDMDQTWFDRVKPQHLTLSNVLFSSCASNAGNLINSPVRGWFLCLFPPFHPISGKIDGLLLGLPSNKIGLGLAFLWRPEFCHHRWEAPALRGATCCDAGKRDWPRPENRHWSEWITCTWPLTCCNHSIDIIYIYKRCIYCLYEALLVMMSLSFGWASKSGVPFSCANVIWLRLNHLLPHLPFEFSYQSFPVVKSASLRSELLCSTALNGFGGTATYPWRDVPVQLVSSLHANPDLRRQGSLGGDKVVTLGRVLNDKQQILTSYVYNTWLRWLHV